jgi:hypothetical protein
MRLVPFSGFPKFLETAALQIGRPEAAIPARANSTLSALANLCAQASQSDRNGATAILEKASEFRDQLHAASLAADLMIDEVSRSLGIGKNVEIAAREPENSEKRRESRTNAVRNTC